jgi:type II secretory pathway pseudopilin PulG
MTLVEVLLVVVVVAMLAAFLIPTVNHAIRSRQNAQAASKLRTLIAATDLYASENGGYPADVNRGVVPAGMTDYFTSLNIDWFAQSTPLGGNWDWGSNQMGFLATMAIASPTASSSQLTDFDRLVDDGNLNTGKFRYNGSQHYYYIIKQ